IILAVTKDKKNKNIADYFFGGRTLPFWARSITFIASWWGAGSALSTADLAFEDGLSAFWYYGAPVLISTAIIILLSKGIRRVGFLTQGKMMEARYSPLVSKLLSVAVLLFMTVTAASQMVGIGDFFGKYLGINYELAIIIGTTIVLIYSTLGGFRGVVLTDIIQFVLLALSAIIVFVVSMKESGGFSQIALVAMEQGKDGYTSFFSGMTKYLPYILTFGTAWMIQANVWQRISATKNEKDAIKMPIMSFFVYIPLYLIVVFTGMAGFVLYETLPQGGIIPAILIDYMNPALSAVVFVGISAAIMSTMDSLINTGAMTLTMDLKMGKTDTTSQMRYSKIATISVTLVALLIALRIRSILEISWIASDIITTGIFVPLVLGFFWRRGTSKGAVASMITGGIYCGYNLLVSLGVALPTFWENQSITQVLMGIGLSLIIYIGVSLGTKPEYEKADAFISSAAMFKKG
ncbi:MAG: sodium:solute symporter family protein, partial [Oscillospiraceae bacterium]